MVSDKRRSPSLRVQVRAIGFALVVVGGLLAWAGLYALYSPLRMMGAGEALVEYAPHDVIALPLALTCFALAAMTFLPAATHSGRGGAKRGSKKANYLFFVAVFGALLAVIASPIAGLGMSQVLAGHNYTICPTSQVWERHPPVRFVLPSGRCP